MNPQAARTLVDAEAMLPVLEKTPTLQGRPLRGVKLLSTWLKPGRYFNAHYRLDVDGTEGDPIQVSAFVVEGARVSQAIEATGSHDCEGAARSSCRRCLTSFVDPPGVLLQVFPVDYRLPTLPACLDLGRVNALLGGRLEFTDFELVAYRPGMRAQILYRGSDGRDVYGKVVVEKYGRGEAVGVQRRVAEALSATKRRFSVPVSLGRVEDLQLDLVTGIRGKKFYSSLYRRRNVDRKIGLLARAIADFHGIGTGAELREYGVYDELDTIDRWVELVSLIFPEFATDLGALHAELLYARPDPRPARALLHRDFYDQQVLFLEGRPFFVDMDTTSRGDRELDLGNFCAHLRVRGLQWNQERRCRTLEERFLDAYPQSIDRSRLDWYRRVTLLRLACVYTLRPGLKEMVPALVAEGLKG
ncbi:MAG: phosphotransferase family protein [Candidatus Binatia bacterium]